MLNIMQKKATFNHINAKICCINARFRDIIGCASSDKPRKRVGERWFQSGRDKS